MQGLFGWLQPILGIIATRFRRWIAEVIEVPRERCFWSIRNIAKVILAMIQMLKEQLYLFQLNVNSCRSLWMCLKRSLFNVFKLIRRRNKHRIGLLIVRRTLRLNSSRQDSSAWIEKSTETVFMYREEIARSSLLNIRFDVLCA